jgi:hypothetical protein
MRRAPSHDAVAARAGREALATSLHRTQGGDERGGHAPNGQDRVCVRRATVTSQSTAARSYGQDTLMNPELKFRQEEDLGSGRQGKK